MGCKSISTAIGMSTQKANKLKRVVHSTKLTHFIDKQLLFAPLPPNKHTYMAIKQSFLHTLISKHTHK